MRLFIAEKPSVGKAIAEGLGGGVRKGSTIECNGAVVTWCFGHLLEQAEPEDYDPALKRFAFETLPIVPEQWKLLPRKGADKSRDEAAAQLRLIQGLLQRCSDVVNAGDPDREGQLLVDEVLEYFDNRLPVRRLWLAAVDPASVTKALGAIEDNAKYQPLKQMALARQRVDWLVGLNLTRAYTVRRKLAGGEGVWSVGRVQTPTLALVVARDREIENFKPLAYFVVGIEVEHANGRFRARWKPAEGRQGLDAEGRCIAKPVAEAVVAKVSGKTGQVTKAERKTMREAPPKLFALSSLQIRANAKHGFTADQVLAGAQALYETHKLTSYPRTDCEYLPESQFDERLQVLEAVKANRPDLAKVIAAADTGRRSAVWNDKKVTAHHGIAPTMHRANVSSLSPVETALYDMIVRSYLAQFYLDYEYEQTSVEVLVEGETFTASGRVPTRQGWREVYGFADEDPGELDAEAAAEAAEQSQRLPAMQRGDAAKALSATTAAKKTKPPRAFTDGTLIAAMTNIHTVVSDPEHRKILKENAGLGTEATRAGIIKTLKGRGFIAEKGKKLLSTADGRALIDALPAPVKDPVLTAVYEDRLRGIERRELSIDTFLAQQVAFVREQVDVARAAKIVGAVSAPPCPSCGTQHGGTLRRIKGPKGFFWGCSRYREGCKATAPDAAGKPVLDGAVKSLAKAPGKIPSPPNAPAVAAPIARKSVPPSATAVQATPSDALSCPACKEGVLLLKRGQNGPFWGCSRFAQGCRCNARDQDGRPNMATVRH